MMNYKFCLFAGLFMCLAVASCSGESGQESAVPAIGQTSTASSSGPGAVPAMGQARCWLDKLDDKPVPHDGSDVVLPSGRSFDIAGWVVDGSYRAADDVQFVLAPTAGGATLRFPAVAGVERVDVAQALHSKAANLAGFTVHGETGSIVAGSYKASVQATSGNAAVQCDLNVTLTVAKAG